MIRVVLAVVLAVFVGFIVWNEAQARRDYKCYADNVPDKYDHVFKRAAKRHLPPELRENWCILKSLCWIESRLNPNAVSGVGAQGLCQIMPATAEDLRKRNHWRGRLRSVKSNAEASAIVYRNYWNIFAIPRTLECRNEVTLASYNAGPGNIIRAQENAGGALCWDRIKYGLPDVTGKHHKETWDYVDRFWGAYRSLRGHGL